MAWTAPQTWTVNQLVTAAMLNTHIRDNLNSMFPIGTFILRAANYTSVETAVEGRWLQCNGVAVSRTTYADLFNYLNGLTPALPFGAGNGTTTFNLPDARGRALYAEGEYTQVDAMGDSDGIDVTLRSPSHIHDTQFGSSSLGGSFTVSTQRDTAATFLADTTGNANMQDTPSFLVAGSYFIKFVA